jgi:hypothetical protein
MQTLQFAQVNFHVCCQSQPAGIKRARKAQKLVAQLSMRQPFSGNKCQFSTECQAVFSASFAPQEAQKRASGGLAVPHWMQKFPGVVTGWAVAGETVGAGCTATLFGLLTSSLNPSAASLVPFLNSLIVFPRLRPISGNFVAPKSRKATTMMITMCMGWIPNGISIS